MSIWLTLALTLLPRILEWITGLLSRGRVATGRQLEQLNQVTWYCDQIRSSSHKVGGTAGGVKPPVERAVAEGLLDVDLTQYRELIDRSVAWMESYARLTKATWDDGLSQAARLLLERLLPGNKPMFAAAEEEEKFQQKMEALPPWALPFIMEVIRLFIESRLKK